MMTTVKTSTLDSFDVADVSVEITPVEKAGDATKLGIKDKVAMQLDLSKFKILVAEDNSIKLQIIVRMLKSTGCAIKVAENGFEAIIQYYEFQPDILLMDIQMPDVDGLAALKAIRNQGGVAPIIAVTANVTKDEVTAYSAAGFNDVIAKPINRELLIKKISMALTAQ
jgi:CheY-like chemotaxis protein